MASAPIISVPAKQRWMYTDNLDRICTYAARYYSILIKRSHANKLIIDHKRPSESVLDASIRIKDLFRSEDSSVDLDELLLDISKYTIKTEV